MNVSSNDDLQFENEFDTITEYTKDYIINASKHCHNYMSGPYVSRYGNIKNVFDVENAINKNNVSLKSFYQYHCYEATGYTNTNTLQKMKVLSLTVAFIVVHHVGSV